MLLTNVQIHSETCSLPLYLLLNIYDPATERFLEVEMKVETAKMTQSSSDASSAAS